jgi:hypothetical protein
MNQDTARLDAHAVLPCPLQADEALAVYLIKKLDEYKDAGW